MIIGLPREFKETTATATYKSGLSTINKKLRVPDHKRFEERPIRPKTSLVERVAETARKDCDFVPNRLVEDTLCRRDSISSSSQWNSPDL